MPDRQLAWAGGILALGLVAGFGLPKVMNKARLGVRRATGTTYTSGVSGSGRAAADPARGRPA